MKKKKTELEEKLLELGYKSVKNYYVKSFSYAFNIYITFNTKNELIGWVKEFPFFMFSSQQDINELQRAYNTMQKDLAILRECKD